MKNFVLIQFMIIIFFLFSCKKEKGNYLLNNDIKAGQKDGIGVEYVDWLPDINCTIINPWEKTDTVINLDLNHDGVDDFSIKRIMCHPSMLGADCEDVTIIPLMDNAVCINSETKWLDTIPDFDSINARKNWTNNESLIYSYFWDINGNTSTDGYWHKVHMADRNYIGFRISSDEKLFYGWIGMKSDSVFRSYDFFLTDYAILKEYPE